MKGALFMGRKSKVSLEEKLKAVEDYLNGNRSVKQIAVTLQVHVSSVKEWIAKYRKKGVAGLGTSSKNKYYSMELKIQAVNEYLAEIASLNQICSKYDISSHGLLQKWIKSYNGHEVLIKSHSSKGDKIMTSSRKTTFEERVEIVSFCIENNDNYQHTSEEFQVSYQQVYTWMKKYEEGGPEALVDRRGKRKDPEEMSDAEKLAAQVRLLEAENKRLQLEVGFLKKLKEVERREIGKKNI